MSADVYSDLTIGLALKNYPKMSPHMLKLIHWIQSHNDISILSADLYSCTADLTSPIVGLHEIVATENDLVINHDVPDLKPDNVISH